LWYSARTVRYTPTPTSSKLCSTTLSLGIKRSIIIFFHAQYTRQRLSNPNYEKEPDLCCFEAVLRLTNKEFVAVIFCSRAETVTILRYINLYTDTGFLQATGKCERVCFCDNERNIIRRRNQQVNVNCLDQASVNKSSSKANYQLYGYAIKHCGAPKNAGTIRAYLCK
jgi:hypothetical protein